MSALALSQINVYPVKSVGGISLSTAWVEKQGLMFDRRFMLALPDGAMVTARKYPKLVKVRSGLVADGVMFTAKGQAPLRVRYADFNMQPTSAQVWSDNFIAYTTTEQANQWFSQAIGHEVQLLFCGEQSNRMREKLGHNVSFADGYPLLVISQASLDELNRRSPETHLMDQFRTNLVVSGAEPFAEDSWKRIRIGEVEFEAVKPCQRCILTTVDVETGAFKASKEPLNTLSQFRADEEGRVFFGQNLVAKNEGMIHQGDRVEVLEYKDKEFYPDKVCEQVMICVEREDIARDFVTFWLEPTQGAMPTYLPGQHLPISIEIDGQSVSRRYTLSSSPSRAGRVAISVKRVTGGQVSNWLIDHLAVGDTLSCERPEGHFHFSEPLNQPILLLSAGSGVTPMLSMLRYLADHDALQDVVFYHQCSRTDDIPYQQELNQLCQRHKGLSVIWSLSQPCSDWQGLKGRLTLSHLKLISDLNRRQVFVCGPDGFMQKAKNLLLKQGVAEENYHQEAFGVQSMVNQPVKMLTLSVNGHVFAGDNQKTLLEQAEDAGTPIANSCRAGLCGACKVTLESGRVEQPEVPALQQHECEQGVVLACCCVPQSDIEVVS